MTITKDQAEEFSRRLFRHFGATVLRKSDAVEMNMVGALFDIGRAFIPDLMDKTEFMNSATTIGKIVYLPDQLSPLALVEIATHECQHVVQYLDGAPGKHKLAGGLGMWWLYLTQPEARARYEAEAYRAGYEIVHALLGLIPAKPSVDLILERGYLLPPEYSAFASRMVESALTATSLGGGPSTQSAQVAYRILRDLGVPVLPYHYGVGA